MPAPTPTVRSTLAEILPIEFAQRTCEYRVLQADLAIEELGDAVTLRANSTKMRDSKLWRRAFTWAEYAKTGHADEPALLDEELEAYDDASKLVREAVHARRALTRGDAISTGQLAAIADVSRIHIANFVRRDQLRASASNSKSRDNEARAYMIRAADARAFLRDRQVAGF